MQTRVRHWTELVSRDASVPTKPSIPPGVAATGMVSGMQGSPMPGAVQAESTENAARIHIFEPRILFIEKVLSVACGLLMGG